MMNRPTRIALALAQLGLAVWVVYALAVESFTLFLILAIATLGLPVHALLPERWRMPFFAALSLAGVVAALGFAGASWVAAIGAVMVGLCHLPVPWSARVALLVAAGALLAALRGGAIANPIPEEVWPVVGSILMFRLALYVYHLRAKPNVRPATAVSYFAMLPNVAFPLFPIVDFKSFAESQPDDSGERLDRGVAWIVRGVFHLLLYRLVYYWVVLEPVTIRTSVELLQYVISTFLLYLRVSGQFHIAIGVLLMFGFKLGETHRLYYLARSFTDLWRRINIYWTDFMTKLVYYPVFFRARRLGQTPALLLSTGVVFVVTWALHDYQLFWLVGRLDITLTSLLFWALLAAMVLITTLLDLRKPKRRKLETRRWSASRALSAAGIFLTMSLLWSLWSSPSLDEWLALFAIPLSAPTQTQALVSMAIAAGFLVVAGLGFADRSLDSARSAAPSPARKIGVAALRAAGLAAVLLVTSGWGNAALPRGPLADVASSLSETRLNARDEVIQQQGYYEELNTARQPTDRRWAVAQPVGLNSVLDEAGAFENSEDVMRKRLRPGVQLELGGKPFSTNSLGLRDREYAIDKPPGTRRIVVYGASFVMGLGVGDGEPFDAVLENTLARNADLAPVEVLNFGVSDHSLLNQLAYFDRHGAAVSPDIALMVVDPHFRFRVYRAGAYLTKRGVALEWPEIAGIVERSGVDPEKSVAVSMRRLHAVGDELMQSIFERFASLARERGAVPVLVLVRMPTSRGSADPIDLEFAERAGVLTIDVTGAYASVPDEAALALSEADAHPNAQGHALLAEALYREILAREPLARVLRASHLAAD